MVTPRKFDVMWAFFSYGGNGGMMSEHPDVRRWMQRVLPKARKDERVGRMLLPDDFADCPITMCRNKAVMTARQDNADFLIMCDSDMQPDMYVGKDPSAVPFWDAAFNFCVDNYDRGPHVVGVPYCGPPSVEENVYVFQWINSISDSPDTTDFSLGAYSRAEAARMEGIHPAAALPTGLIMYDMRAFDLIEPRPEDAVERIMANINMGDGRREFTTEEMRRLIGYAVREKTRLSRPFFYYEYGGQYGEKYEAEKCSTEDVTNTRDISLAGMWKLGYNPVHCAWSSWAGHWKPKCVGKPRMITADALSVKLQDAAVAGRSARDRMIYVNSPIADEGDWPAANGNGHVHALVTAE